MNWQPYLFYPGFILWGGMFVFFLVIPWRVKKADAALGIEETALKGLFWRFLRGSLYAGSLVSGWCKKRVMPKENFDELSRADRILFRLFFWWIAIGLIHLVVADWFVSHYT